ncbi:metallo-beta-lactamase superfamily protein [Mollisia scopiformis]|uniref:Metallo-beta-lactamase superfamily protein n=1 Tax=Mollisia scopiformis TaxID=149040 RepID=A0A194X0B4_MOLSC|nr:metallo-beta-lactamase superfamily protein [Mollisia scopiformis]KUJ13399.1 metallo-beta-lactamase superfamily protein [Mollisia scopiformis]
MTPQHFNLVEVDTLEAIVIIDNEIDIMSTVPHNTVTNTGRMPNLSLSQPSNISKRGDCQKEMPMEAICCGAHGLSILITVTKGAQKHSMLFDVGPEEEAWERNAKRLSIDLKTIERIQLSHWHRDHSGGMLRAISMITSSNPPSPVVTDLHPSRPTYRGFMVGSTPISMQVDPSFEEMEDAGAVVEKFEEAHTVLDDMFLVSGEIPRFTGYEKGVKGGIRFEEDREEWVKDEEILDERFLMCNLKGKGIILFTGCSHGGVVNTALHAKSLLNDEVPLYAVVGGYHLVGEQEANVEATVRDLKKLDPKVLLPGHCSGWRVKLEIEKQMPGRLVPCGVGARLSF